jgi:hypothetical protein
VHAAGREARPRALEQEGRRRHVPGRHGVRQVLDRAQARRVAPQDALDDPDVGSSSP